MRWPLFLVLVSSAAAAHDLDVVYLQLAEGDGGFVERMTMAAGTLGQLAPVDADNDGELTEADLAQRGEAVRVGVWEQMPLFAGDRPCRYFEPKVAIRDTYLELWATWACGPGELRQELKWLRILPANYRVVLGSQLDGERNRATAEGNVQTLFIPRPGGARREGAPWPLGAVLLVAGLAAAGLSVRRRGRERRGLQIASLVVLALAGWFLAGFWFP